MRILTFQTVKFNGYNNVTFYNVESINAPKDNSGIHWVHHSNGPKAAVGCKNFPCDGAFKDPVDYFGSDHTSHIVATMEGDLTVLIGPKENNKRFYFF